MDLLSDDNEPEPVDDGQTQDIDVPENNEIPDGWISTFYDGG